MAVDMMKHGAYDYIVKGAVFMLMLPAVVNRALERVRQVERLAETEEELRRTHDELERRVEQRTAELAEVNHRLRIEIDERKRAEDRAQRPCTGRCGRASGNAAPPSPSRVSATVPKARPLARRP